MVEFRNQPQYVHHLIERRTHNIMCAVYLHLKKNHGQNIYFIIKSTTAFPYVPLVITQSNAVIKM